MAGNGRQKGNDALAVALACGLTVRDAAAAADVGERTATRRVADPDFRRRVDELRADMVGRALGRIANGMTEAADALRALLSAERESVRLGAARALVELGCRLRETVELERRVQALELLYRKESS